MLLPALISITIIYSIVWGINKIRVKKFCPICAGVSITWLWLLIALFFGYHFDTLLIGILMGASVVGLMYKLETTVWAHAFAAVGFAAVYFLLNQNWLWFGISLVLTVTLGIWQKPRKVILPTERVINSKAKEIEKKLEECCP